MPHDLYYLKGGSLETVQEARRHKHHERNPRGPAGLEEAAIIARLTKRHEDYQEKEKSGEYAAVKKSLDAARLQIH